MNEPNASGNAGKRGKGEKWIRTNSKCHHGPMQRSTAGTLGHSRYAHLPGTSDCTSAYMKRGRIQPTCRSIHSTPHIEDHTHTV